MGKVLNMKEGNREHMEDAVIDNREVLFQWCMLNTDVSDADSAVVLELLVELWFLIQLLYWSY